MFTTSKFLVGVTNAVEEKRWEGMRGLEETNLLLKIIGRHHKSVPKKTDAKLVFKKAEMIAESCEGGTGVGNETGINERGYKV